MNKVKEEYVSILTANGNIVADALEEAHKKLNKKIPDGISMAFGVSLLVQSEDVPELVKWITKFSQARAAVEAEDDE